MVVSTAAYRFDAILIPPILIVLAIYDIIISFCRTVFCDVITIGHDAVIRQLCNTKLNSAILYGIIFEIEIIVFSRDLNTL